MSIPAINISKQLIKAGKTLAVAESCTGGLLANILTNIPGSSQYFLLGAVTYSNQAKTTLLNIHKDTLKRYGAVSSAVAELMAKNVKKLASSDFGIGITGIAGPFGGTPKKPVGTVFISAVDNHQTITEKHIFSGSRLEIKRKTALKALSILKILMKQM